ncbi:protein AUXIN RESPONSE 4 [Silene latifolia]|uniref:protein AUXIN RESPONSE 4 n=1 Tax=Silene latifolia TaxID=37657 RepID=UPI003D77F92A
MAIITDYDDQPTSPSKSRPKPKPKSKTEPKPERRRPATNQTPTPNPFTFWFYLIITVSIITFLFISFPSLSSPDPKTWFLKLPISLRSHYSSGRIIKVQVNPNQPQVQVFTYSQGPRTSENVLIVHGLGCTSFSFKGIVDGLASKGLFGVAIDLPGSGFSDKTVEREEERVLGSNGGLFGRIFEVYEEIKEKGIFWGFDSLIEHGHLPYHELNQPKTRVSKHKVVVPLDLGSSEVGRVIGEVVSTMGLAPLHLVLHDSALVMGANWIVENSGLVRSVTLLDSLPREMALPLGLFELPVIREVILRVDYLFGRLIGKCCLRSGFGSSLEAHRVLLKGRDGGAAIVGMGKKLNHSFELGEWVSMVGMKGMPMQVMWSGSWSEEWSEEGKRVAEVVSQGVFIRHSGGRWPQEDTSSEVTQSIYSFVSSLPKTERKSDDEPLPEHIQKKLDEAKAAGHHHHDGHDHGAQAGYMDAYGLGNGHGHGWGM